MALIGSIATVQAQVPRADVFAAAFAYLTEVFQPGSAAAARLRALGIGETGKVELSGGAFALEQVYNSKVRADGFFESHRRYIDVQVVVEGEEIMELADIARMTVRQPYNPDRDLIIYEDATGSGLRVRAGEAAVFFPADVHMPGLCVTRDPVLVRKTVVKVPVPA